MATNEAALQCRIVKLFGGAPYLGLGIGIDDLLHRSLTLGTLPLPRIPHLLGAFPHVLARREELGHEYPLGHGHSLDVSAGPQLQLHAAAADLHCDENRHQGHRIRNWYARRHRNARRHQHHSLFVAGRKDR